MDGIAVGREVRWWGSRFKPISLFFGTVEYEICTTIETISNKMRVRGGSTPSLPLSLPQFAVP